MKDNRSFILKCAIGILLILTCSIQVHEYLVSKQSVYGNAVDEAVRPLRLERQELEKKRAKLQKQLDVDQRGKGTGVFVFTELKSDIYEKIFPVMNKYHLTGTLAISDTEYPGQEGCITVAQYKQLVNAGWSTCVYWDTWTELPAYVKSMQARCKALGIALPRVIYIKSNMYKKELDEELIKCGFEIVVHHGEENYPLIAKKDEDRLWHVGSVSWNRVGVKNYITKVENFGGVIALSIDFGSRRSGYKKDIFQNMCEYIAGRHETFMVMDFSAARKYRKSLGVNMVIQSEIDWCNKEIAEINREINQIYDKN